MAEFLLSSPSYGQPETPPGWLESAMNQGNQISMFDLLHMVHRLDNDQLTQDPIHVCQVIKQLNYRSLVRRGIVPDLAPSFTSIRTKRYFRWVYKQMKDRLGKQVFSAYGTYMDGLVRKMIADIIPVNWGPENDNDGLTEFRSANTTWSSTAYDLLIHICRQYEINFRSASSNQEKDLELSGMTDKADNLLEAIVDKGLFNKSYPRLGALNKVIGEWFGYCGNSAVTFNSEYRLEDDEVTLFGHPDIVSEQCVIDIKTSSGFKSMAESSYLQVLSYVALMRANGVTVNWLGILLPLQVELITVDVSSWDCSAFLQLLLEESQKLVQARQSPLQRMIAINYAMKGVGSTIPKGSGTRSEALTSWSQMAPGLPCQIFLSGNIGGRFSISDGDIASMAQTIESLHLEVYIHAPYSINLSRPWTDKDPNDRTWAVRYLIQFLSAGDAIGCRGVVVHVGKAVDLPFDVALNNMEHSVRTALNAATPQCPLLLETPVGAGTELCFSVEDLAAFYSRFDESERQKFKICIDTCHVFVADYDPYTYIQSWVEHHPPSSVGLIHFNDSRKKRGCRADGHAPCGRGNIGARKLAQVSAWGRLHSVAMVTE